MPAPATAIRSRRISRSAWVRPQRRAPRTSRFARTARRATIWMHGSVNRAGRRSRGRLLTAETFDKDTKVVRGLRGLTNFGDGRALCVLCSFLCVLVAGSASAQFQMPDPKEMSGIPRPVDDLPNGAISVRLIRGSLSNNIVGHDVKLVAGDKVLTVKPDDAGRAEFKEVPPGSTVRAVADVDGEHLESREFPAPTRGGIRLMLVATDT